MTSTDDTQTRKIKRQKLYLASLLALVTAMIYWQMSAHGFINYDDAEYVYNNPIVLKGLSVENVLWAFTSTIGANWHPLTALSHMLDVQLFGLDPGLHHLTSLFFHILNTLLLFKILSTATHSLWKSAVVAGLFAVHPLHIESVAWIAERKDVLSTFFWFLTMVQYIRYVKKPGKSGFLMLVTLFTMGLMAKAMLVTLPFVLLLFDFWPLERVRFNVPGSTVKKPSTGQSLNRRTLIHNPLSSFIQANRHLVLEKIPLFAIVLLFSIVTFAVQKIDGAVAAADLIPFDSRFFNAIVSYGQYVIKMVWPLDLAVFYPFPAVIPLWQPIIVGTALVLFSLIVIATSKRSPWLFVGWFWYLGTLVPVIGLVQVGSQAMADRYTYVPLIGLFIAIVWSTDKLFKKSALHGQFAAITSLLLILCLSVLTWTHVQYWKDSLKLYSNTIKNTKNNGVIYNNLGLAYLNRNMLADAAYYLSLAIDSKPDSPKFHNNAGIVLMRAGRLDLAESFFKRAIALNPNYVNAYVNLGILFSKSKRYDQVIPYLLTALKLNPQNPKIHGLLAAAYDKQNQKDRAIYHYSRAIQANPHLTQAKKRLRVLQKTSTPHP